MTEWQDLDCFERAILCNLWRQAPRTGRKPANIPLRALLRGLDPAIRDSALVKDAVKSLIKKGLVEWYRKRKGRTLTITPEGQRLARDHCPEEWEILRSGMC